MMTTRRLRGRVDSDSAARRPRPNVERPAEPPLRPNVLPRPHHLANEGLRTLGALVAVADAAGPDMQVIVARRHGCEHLRKSRRRRSDR